MGRKELRRQLKDADIPYNYRKIVYCEIQKQRKFDEWKKTHTFKDAPRTCAEAVVEKARKGDPLC